MGIQNKLKNVAKIGLVGLIGFLPACEKDVTAPEIIEDEEKKINATKFVADYFSSKGKFPSVDSVNVNGKDVIIYGDFIDPYNKTVTDSTYLNGEETIVRITKTPRVDYINVDIGERDMSDDAPTFYLSTLTPKEEYLDIFYDLFSRKRDGPDVWRLFVSSYWDIVENNLNRQDSTIPITVPITTLDSLN